MNVSILGFGPSAMFSVMACNDHGIKPTVIGNFAAMTAGAFYYHWLPKSYADKVMQYSVDYRYFGDNETYTRKQWGKPYASSFGKYSSEFGYSPKDMYNEFIRQARYSQITKMLTTEDVLNLCNQYDLVICTFPLKEVFDKVQKILRPVVVEDYYTGTSNTIMYDGTPYNVWSRKSWLFGRVYTEYTKPDDVPKGAEIRNIMDIHPEVVAQPMLVPNNLHFSGRYAELNRSRLAHEAYFKMEELINAQ